MTKVVVRKDEKGLYVKHGDDVVRPIVNKWSLHEVYLEGKEYRGGLKRTKNFTNFKAGDRVEKFHFGGSTDVKLRNDEYSEVWYIHGNGY